MDLKKLLLSLALSLPLAATGCGDDGDGNGGGGGDGGIIIGDCEANEQIWKLTGLTLPEQDGPVIGFNLDGVDNTTLADPQPIPEDGCAKDDLEGGVDNMVGVLIGLLPSFAPDLDIQGAIDDAIAGEDITIYASVRNYEGAGSTDVTLSLIVNGEAPAQLQDIPATVDESGAITAELSSLPLEVTGIPVEGTTIDLTLAITDGKVVIPAPSGGVTEATIGGSILYGDDTSGPDSFRSQLQNIIDAIDAGVAFEDVDPIISGLTDMSSNDVDCDSLSIGALAEFTQEC